MCATVSVDSVHSPTAAPRRAAANAASQPACPAPTTMTSNRRAILYDLCDLCALCVLGVVLLSDAEAREDVLEQILRRARAGHFFERRSRVGEIREHEFFR